VSPRVPKLREPTRRAPHPRKDEDEDIVCPSEKEGCEQANLPREPTSTGRFGTSMSAPPILGLKQVPRVGLFAH